MKNLTTLLALFIPFLLTAQTNIVWTGGTPGQETQWNEPQNWDANRIPGENDHVVIHAENNGHFSQPVLDRAAQVASLEIGAGAELHITQNGKLVVDGAYTYSEGISMYGGKLVSEGAIILKDIEPEFIAKLDPVFQSLQVTYSSQSQDYEFSAASSDYSQVGRN